eukprot:CAMPEP_0198671404 /NCGR_PEP_ID=MMETSP1467-20131203/85981_1 /TAXON_ID=1462469 /ORGANISM="unid. sp., Strain CCMP2135" /LENGTH=206 /DNA_ID=CAMNT_0044408205 /DNA_START=254 /DNA_END=871 /DNA_ORIENTATION=-
MAKNYMGFRALDAKFFVSFVDLVTDIQFIYDIGVELDNGRLLQKPIPRFFVHRLRRSYVFAWIFVVLSRSVGAAFGFCFARKYRDERLLAGLPLSRAETVVRFTQCTIYGMLSQSLLKSITWFPKPIQVPAFLSGVRSALGTYHGAMTDPEIEALLKKLESEHKKVHQPQRETQIWYQFFTACIEDIPLFWIHLHYELTVGASSIW